MPTSRLAMVLAFAMSTIIACEDPFTNGVPTVSPGVAVPGLVNVCRLPFGCSAWSADSKTLYIVAGVAPGLASLVAVDPATLTFRAIGPIDVGASAVTAAADGSAIYFETPEPAPGGLIVKRMSLSDGSTTTVAKASNQFSFGIVVSPDGTSLAYHAPGSTFEIDTIVVLDVPSGTRRAATIEGSNTVGTFSADGAVLSIISHSSGAVHLWHITTGARDTIPALRAYSGLVDVAWSGGAFRLLFNSSSDGSTYTDTSLAGGSALTYTAEPNPNRFQWLPDAAAMLTVTSSPICGPHDCNSSLYDFVYSTATKGVTVGRATSFSPPLVSASPDGHWITHAETFDALYLLHHESP